MSYSSRVTLGVLLAFWVVAVRCPYGLSTSTSCSSGSRPQPGVGAAALACTTVATVAVAAVAGGVGRSNYIALPRTSSVRTSNHARCVDKRGRPEPLQCVSCSDDEAASTTSHSPHGSAGESDESEDDDDADADELAEVGVEEDGGEPTALPAKRPPPPKLWTKAQFPEGVVPLAANWDMANLSAAQKWSCPCTDRVNCIGAYRGVSVLHLYEHRKTYLTTCNSSGGKRDAMRSSLEAHYSVGTKTFTRSFVVGPVADCCAASYAIACGVSCQTCKVSLLTGLYTIREE